MCRDISPHHKKCLISRHFCSFLTVVPPHPTRAPRICCWQPIVANQTLWSCLQAGGVSPTSSSPSASYPVTGLFTSGWAPRLCHVWNLPSSSSCQELLRRWLWSPWGEEHVEAHWGPWRTGRPLPAWARTTGGSIYVSQSIQNHPK